MYKELADLSASSLFTCLEQIIIHNRSERINHLKGRLLQHIFRTQALFNQGYLWLFFSSCICV